MSGEGPRVDERRANLMLLWAVGGLLLLAVAGLGWVALAKPAPASEKATDVAESPAVEVATEQTAPAAPPPAKAVTQTAAPVAPPPAAEPSIPKTMPEQMAHLLPGTRQMIVITGARLGSNTGELALYDLDDGHWVEVLKTPANFGKNGLVNGKTRTSGHLETPTGLWWIGGFVFGQHASPPSGTKMPYRAIKDDSWWSSVRDSTYNSWVSSKSEVAGEHLADAKVQYEYAFDTGYNALPNERVFGRGTAIFIHCFEPPGNSLGQFTHGCIAIDRKMMIELFAKLDPDRKPSCAIGTLQKGSSTSVWAY